MKDEVHSLQQQLEGLKNDIQTTRRVSHKLKEDFNDVVQSIDSMLLQEILLHFVKEGNKHAMAVMVDNFWNIMDSQCIQQLLLWSTHIGIPDADVGLIPHLLELDEGGRFREYHEKILRQHFGFEITHPAWVQENESDYSISIEDHPFACLSGALYSFMIRQVITYEFTFPEPHNQTDPTTYRSIIKGLVQHGANPMLRPLIPGWPPPRSYCILWESALACALLQEDEDVLDLLMNKASQERKDFFLDKYLTLQEMDTSRLVEPILTRALLYQERNIVTLRKHGAK